MLEGDWLVCANESIQTHAAEDAGRGVQHCREPGRAGISGCGVAQRLEDILAEIDPGGPLRGLLVSCCQSRQVPSRFTGSLIRPTSVISSPRMICAATAWVSSQARAYGLGSQKGVVAREGALIGLYSGGFFSPELYVILLDNSPCQGLMKLASPTGGYAYVGLLKSW